jgi:hypothetical protein
MRLTIEFGDEEREEAMDALRAWEYKAVISGMMERCRGVIKYGYDEGHEEHAEWARNQLIEALDEHGLLPEF